MRVGKTIVGGRDQWVLGPSLEPEHVSSELLTGFKLVSEDRKAALGKEFVNTVEMP